jgi:hypothetical protein
LKTGAGALVPGQWAQVAFTWDGTGGNASVSSAHIYVNGVEQSYSSSSSGSNLCNSGSITNKSFRIGNASGGLSGMSGSLNGKIGYVAVYKYRVLSPTELGQLDTQLPISSAVVTSMTGTIPFRPGSPKLNFIRSVLV